MNDLPQVENPYYDFFQAQRQADFSQRAYRGLFAAVASIPEYFGEQFAGGGVGIGALITTDAKSHYETNSITSEAAK